MTSSLIETYASDEWVQHIALVRERAEDESHRTSALELAAALFSLCDSWIAPLAVSLRVECRDPEELGLADDERPPAHPFWLLRERELDDRIDLYADWIDPQERRVDKLGARELVAVIEEALDQPMIKPLQAGLVELTVNALGISLPRGVELQPRYGGRPVRPVVVQQGERAAVLGPRAGIAGGTPARLRATESYGTTRITLELCWDFWREHPAGRADLRAALDRVLARGRGWQLEKTSSA